MSTDFFSSCHAKFRRLNPRSRIKLKVIHRLDLKRSLSSSWVDSRFKEADELLTISSVHTYPDIVQKTVCAVRKSKPAVWKITFLICGSKKRIQCTNICSYSIKYIANFSLRGRVYPILSVCLCVCNIGSWNKV